MKKKTRDITRPTTIGDLDDLGVQIITAITKTLEDYPKKDDLKREVDRIERKFDDKISGLETKVDTIEYNVSDIRRRVIDLEVDTVPRKDFEDLKFLVAAQRHP